MIKLAVVGTGYWGKNLVRNFASMPGAELAVCCDLDKRALEKIAKAYRVRTSADFDSMLGDGSIDAIVISTPASTHYKLGEAALEAGKHVYVEKPLALKLSEGRRLVELAEKKNLRLMVGHLLLYHPAVRELKRMADSGELGDIYYVYSQRVNLGKVRSDENALWSLAPHDISVVLHLLGESPAEVLSRGASYLQPGIEDVVFTSLRFPSGRIAQVHVSWLDPHRMRKFTIVGSRKMVTFDDADAVEKIRVYDKGFETRGEYESYGDSLTLRSGDIRIPMVEMAEPLRLECEHFVECVAAGKTPLTDGREGLAVLAVLDAADKSLKSGGAAVRL